MSTTASWARGRKPAVTTAAPRSTWVSPWPWGAARPTKPGKIPPPPAAFDRGSTASRTFTIRTDCPGDAQVRRTSANAGSANRAAASPAETLRTPFS
jgi:hypothetical protein